MVFIAGNTHYYHRQLVFHMHHHLYFCGACAGQPLVTSVQLLSFKILVSPLLDWWLIPQAWYAFSFHVRLKVGILSLAIYIYNKNEILEFGV